ncbi:MAG: tetratricopeptide repeat protein [Desulforhopalus sp.]
MNTSRQPTEAELQELVARAFEDHQNGLLAVAQKHYLQLLQYFPEVPVLHYNLGLIYYEQAEYPEARDSFALASSFSPQDLDIQFNLALSQKKTGDLEGAVNTFKAILEREVDEVDTLYNLAGCFRELHIYSEAVDMYLKLLQVAPAHASANNNLAYIYHLLGDKKRALAHYRRVLEISPGHDSARHMVAALTGDPVSCPPDSYVVDIFDNYSEKYDYSLVQELEYCVPATLRSLLNGISREKKVFRSGLDLGCGTGLGGEAFRDLIEVFEGIDLSEKMVELAMEKAIYSQLYCTNIADFLSSTERRFDFFLAADVFAYVGDLKAMFSLLKECGVDHPFFCFSTEKSIDDGFRLQESGRFAHSSAYIQETAGITGWKIVSTISAGLRKEKGAWLEGDLWVLQG